MSEAVAPGIIRKLWPGEQHMLRDHLLRLDPESRRSRFCSAVSDEFIDHYAARVFRSGSLIHGAYVDGVLRAAAELYPDSEIMAEGAEVAFSVESAFQNLGLGTMLLERSILAARNRGIRRLHLSCLAHNRRMQQIVRKFDAELSFEHDEVQAELTAPYPTAVSLAQEATADVRGMAGAMFQAQRRATGVMLDLFLPTPKAA
ncbi:GNAT family N-acetyltransferase [Aquabacter sp. P-9]|uniref:GNAT family N-acetyltransferase n=1 Tax=Aquabacter sediminis TaxID=3029197 RepID=UPI00237DA97B|nr:GNAT family N-acetyltransferase [Aquabacter sp. P-9]MDE1569791.1 GNAT family N-acetyltransferase [Aquabacter sp. P-9]